MIHAATLSVSPIGKGSITGSEIECPVHCSEEYDDGSVETLSANPEAGWQFSGWSGSIESMDNPITVTVTGYMTIFAIFSEISVPDYTITATAGTGGSILPPGNISVMQGNSQTFVITPDAGYHVADVLVDGSSAGAVSSYTFTNVRADHSIRASFAINIITYSITASAGAGGNISPAGNVGVSQGSSQTFIITPNAGYHVADVLVDGTSAGAVSSYTFTNVRADHSIRASFAINIITYSITASAGAGGNISPAGNVGVSQGSSQTFIITPNAGYHVADVLVDGTSAGAVSSYTFTNVTVSHSIRASFAINTGTDTYTLMVSISGEGAVTMDPEGNMYESGTQVLLTASATKGWVFSRWNGDITGSANPVSLTMNADKAIEAIFLEDGDIDGVASVEEQGPDGTDTSYDGNNDGIPDREQANVASLHSYDGQYYCTIVSPQETTLVGVTMTAPPDGAPADYEFPYGLISFTITGINPGDSTNVRVILGEICTTYYKYDETRNAWEEFIYDNETGTGAEVNKNIVTLSFVDGLRGDQDGAANGVIVDAGTPAVKHQSEQWYERSCFISASDACSTFDDYAWAAAFFFLLIMIRIAALSKRMRRE
jgi:hypothetical protein